jgi:hypothetical protein
VNLSSHIKALLAGAALAALAPFSANAAGWAVIGGICYNPAGIAIPAVAAIHNPHCLGVTPPSGGGGGSSGGGSSGGGSSGGGSSGGGGGSGGSGGGSGAGGNNAGAGNSNNHQRVSRSGHQNSAFMRDLIIGCMATPALEMAATTYVNQTERRQLTLYEAYALGMFCLPAAPFAIVGMVSCPDNHATREIAKLAYRFVQLYPGQSQAPFTEAYADACRTGTVPRSLRDFAHKHRLYR